MGVITILLAAGIGVFLFWFFEGIVREAVKADNNETEYVFLRRGNDASFPEPGCAARPSGCRMTVRVDIPVLPVLPVQDADARERISARRARRLRRSLRRVRKRGSEPSMNARRGVDGLSEFGLTNRSSLWQFT